MRPMKLVRRLLQQDLSCNSQHIVFTNYIKDRRYYAAVFLCVPHFGFLIAV